MYYITTDAACDLPTSYYRDGLHVIPMSYTIGGEEFGIEKTISIEDFYIKVKGGAMPTTTLINSYYAKEQLEPILKAGNDLLHICFSSGLSATYENLCLAIKELSAEYPDRKVLLIDSLSASLGLGMLILRAMDNRDNGMSINANFTDITAAAGKMCHYFTVDDLFHLQRGGRVSKATAIIGTALKIKPIMYCNIKGKLAPFDKVISRKKALLTLVDKTLDHIDMTNLKYVSVAHSSCLTDAQLVADRLKEKIAGVGEVILSDIGPIIGSHTGCGVVAAIFLGDTRIEPKDESLA